MDKVFHNIKKKNELTYFISMKKNPNLKKWQANRIKKKKPN